LGGSKLQKNVQTTILEYINRETIKDYWDYKGRINSECFHKVDWDAMRKVMKSTSIAQRIWIVKRASHDCAANAVMFKRRQKDSAQCKFCGNEENVLHVYKCMHTEVQEVWKENITEFQKELIRMNTDPVITEKLIQGMHRWRTEEQEETLSEQGKIGWDGILEGCIGIHWKEQQALYYKHIQSKKGAEQLAQKVIKRLWKIAWHMWDNRNKKEHEGDQSREEERIRAEVEKEIALGTQHILKLEPVFNESELQKARGSNLIYSQAWLRQARSIRAREIRREEQSGSTRQMRATLYRFLQRPVHNSSV
jgi:hypothetical protein